MADHFLTLKKANDNLCKILPCFVLKYTTTWKVHSLNVFSYTVGKQFETRENFLFLTKYQLKSYGRSTFNASKQIKNFYNNEIFFCILNFYVLTKMLTAKRK